MDENDKDIPTQQEYEDRLRRYRQRKRRSYIALAVSLVCIAAGTALNAKTETNGEFLAIVFVLALVAGIYGLFGRLFAFQPATPEQVQELRRKRRDRRARYEQRLAEIKAENSGKKVQDAVMGALAYRFRDDIMREEVENLEHQLKTTQLRRQIKELKGSVEPKTQNRIEQQQASIQELENERSEELRSIAGDRSFDQLRPDEQDRYIEADNSWEEKLRVEREKLRELKQNRRTAQ
jgi:hypothetical protein